MEELKMNEEITILIAEDDDGHAFLIQNNLADAGILNNIIRFKDGVETLAFLQKKNAQTHRISNRPYLLLLDIRMPRMDGLETLKIIKNDPELMKIPVIMLTTTDNPREIEECYKLGCNCYLTKPVNPMQFTELLKRLGMFIVIMKVATANGSERNHDKH